MERGCRSGWNALRGHRAPRPPVPHRSVRQGALVWTAEQPEIFAVAVDLQGAVYAATSPDGKIYRIEGGKATEYFAPQAKYIWSLAVGSDGALYAGTGDQGKVFRIASEGKGEVYYATGQSHVTGLAVDREGRVLAGTEPNGILYRISAKDKAFVLYDAALPEIRAISQAPDGAIYTVAMGGSLAKRIQGIPQGAAGSTGGVVTTATSTSITVTAESAQSRTGDQGAGRAGQAAGDDRGSGDRDFHPGHGCFRRGEVCDLQINPDNTVETLWSSKEENVYDLLPWKGQLLFATDANGRVYRLSTDRKVTLIAQTNDGEAIRLVRRVIRCSQLPGTWAAFTGWKMLSRRPAFMKRRCTMPVAWRSGATSPGGRTTRARPASHFVPGLEIHCAPTRPGANGQLH